MSESDSEESTQNAEQLPTLTLARMTCEEAAKILRRELEIMGEMKAHCVEHLVFDNIKITQEIKDVLSKLMEVRSWKSLTMIDCRNLDPLSPMVLSNVSRLELISTTGLANNETNFTLLQSLLMSSDVPQLRVCDQTLGYPAAAQLAFGVGCARSLRLLDLSGSHNMGTRISLLCKEGITKNTSLTDIILRDCNLNDDAAALMVQSVARHGRIEHLALSNNHCGPRTVVALSDLLSCDKCTLKRLDLSIMRCQMDFKILFASIVDNDSLIELDLANSLLVDEHLDCLSESLQRNTTLKELNLSSNRAVSAQCLSRFFAKLPSMSLRHLNILRLGACHSTMGDLMVLKELSGALKLNGTLEMLRMNYWGHVHVARRIQFLVNANRGGRGQLILKDNFPLSLWPFALQRLQRVHYCQLFTQNAIVDNIFHFVRNSPALWERVLVRGKVVYSYRDYPLINQLLNSVDS